LSYAAKMSSTGAAHDDVPNFGLDTIVDAHGSLRIISLLVLAPSFSTSTVVVIDSVTLVIWL
jgi:hypothetical protein